jgi:hypothetical protein
MPKEYLPIDEKTWETTGSKFISAAGEYVSKFQMPKWKAANKSYEFPFVITDPREEGKADSGFASMNRFALEPYFKAAGVAITFENGKLAFDKVDFVNKTFIAVYTDQKDERPASEGGTGKTFVKLFAVKPINSDSNELA